MLMLEQDTIKKGWVDKNVMELDVVNNDSRKYKIEAIRNSAIYTRESKSDSLSALYYLVSWKGYPEEENT